MNKWIETYMEEKNLKPNELFKLQSETYLDEYCFDETGVLRRKKNNHLEMASAEILGRLMRGVVIEKVKPKGRYIPKKGENYWYVNVYGDVLNDIYFSERSECLFNRTLVFRTKEEAKDYKRFLEQVDKYKKEFLEGSYNYYFYYDTESKLLGISYQGCSLYDMNYFGSEENVREFRSIVGDERIKKYFFGVYD